MTACCIRTLALALALLASGTLHAQSQTCRYGRSSQPGIDVTVSAGAPAARVAVAMNEVLRAQGYEVRSAPQGAGAWSIAPRFTWLPEVQDEDWHTDEHPGIQLTVRTRTARDSTRIELGARALCRMPVPGGSAQAVGDRLEIITTTLLASAVLEAVENMPAEEPAPAGQGQAAAAAAGPAQEPQRGALQVPTSAAGFHTVGRHDYPDPRYGTTIRYGRQSDDLFIDIFVYPGERVDSACSAACAVDKEADGFVASLPEMSRAGGYQAAELAGDERLQPAPGAAWAYGRHLAFSLRRDGRQNESHMWIYSFPGFFLKVRASYPPSPASMADVQAFVNELVQTLMSGGGA